MEIVSKVETKFIYAPEKRDETPMKGIDASVPPTKPFDWNTKRIFRDKKGNAVPFEVAACFGCVQYYRKLMMPIKDITLCKRIFQKVEDWCRFQLRDDKAEMNLPNITLDGVHIKLASALSVKDFEVHFYETTKTPQA